MPVWPKNNFNLAGNMLINLGEKFKRQASDPNSLPEFDTLTLDAVFIAMRMIRLLTNIDERREVQL